MNKERNINYELIRVIAMFFVLFIHTIPSYNPNIYIQNLIYFLRTIFLTCNGLFFMLSGIFALNTDFTKKNAYYNYYKKKIINLIIPIIFYMFLRSCFDANFNIFNLNFLHKFINNVLGGYSNTEYWFLYSFVGNLLLVPLLQPTFKNLSKKGMKAFVVCSFIVEACHCYLPYLGFEFQWNYPFWGMLFYFYLGYILEKLVIDKKHKKRIFFISIIFIIITILLYNFNYTNNITDLSPIYNIITIAMFITLKDTSIKSNIGKKIIKIIGKYSFSFYMIHVIYRAIYVHSYKTFKLILLVFISSFATSVIIENTILKLIKYISNKLFTIYENSKLKKG